MSDRWASRAMARPTTPTHCSQAIEKHAVLFFPSGTYRVSRSLTLKPDSTLIGLNPATTQISLIDGSPAFGGEGAPVGIIVAPKGGRNIVRALAITTGNSNPRAAGVIWMAGKNSLLDDVSFPGQRFFGSGFRGFTFRRPTPSAGASPVRPTFAFSPAAADLLITHGGGIFRNNWAHGSNARIGLRVENTDTPGKIYQMSVEHHMRVEAEFHNVRNWEIYAFQTEEENPAGANAYALDIEDSEGLLFANTYMYRVSRNVLPKTYAIVTRAPTNRFRKRESVQPDAARIRQRGLQRSQWRLRASALLHALRGECRCEATRSRPRRLVIRRRNCSCCEWFQQCVGPDRRRRRHRILHRCGERKDLPLERRESNRRGVGGNSGQPQVLGFVAPATSSGDRE
jgi:hypothetical protein